MPAIKYARASFGLSLTFLCILFLFLLNACTEEETGQQSDGDVSTDGDQEAKINCVSQNDCPSGSSCIQIGLEYVCTPMCNIDFDCQEAYPGGCCKEIGTANFCMPLLQCGQTDGDEAKPEDGDEPPASCTPDTYGCDGPNTVQRCTSSGDWTVYKRCGENSCCVNGDCVTMDDGLNCEIDPECFCAPGSYRCRGIREIQKCRTDCKDWDLYVQCKSNEICSDGFCNPIDDPIEDGDEPADGDAVVDGDEEPVCIPCNLTDGCQSNEQYCLPDKDGESEGCCEMFCDLPGGTCPRGMKCESGTCQHVEGYCMSDAMCATDEFCDKLPDRNEGMCETYCYTMGFRCPNHSKCDENPTSLNYGKCIYDQECVTCSFDQQCENEVGVGNYCNIAPGYTEGCCMEMCGPQNECPGQMTCCPDGRCGNNCGTKCTKECPAGYKCDPLYDDCASSCPPCEPDACCDSTTAPNCKPGCTCQNPLICGFLLKPCCLGYSCSAIVYGVLGYCI